MTNLQVASDDMIILTNNYPNKKNISKGINNDFLSTLKNETTKHGKSSTLYSHSTDNKKLIEEMGMQKKGIKIKFIDEKARDEDNEKTEDIDNELTTLFQIINNLIIEFEENSMKFEETNLETLKLKIENLYNSLEQVLKEEDLPFVHEDTVKAYETIENLISSFKEQLDQMENNIGEDLRSTTMKEISMELDKIIDKLIGIKASVQLNREESKNIKGEKNIENSNDNLNEKIEFNKISSREEASDIDEIIAEDSVKEGEGVKEYGNSNVFSFEAVDNATVKENSQVLDKALPEIDEKQIINQIVNKAKLVIDDNKQEIRIKLKPEILGELMLKVEAEKGVLLARVMVDNYRTKELIEANLYQFREEIKENGLDIKTFEVFVGNNEDFQRENKQEFKFNKKSKKLNVKDKEIEGLKMYHDRTVEKSQELDGKGRLNLFA